MTICRGIATAWWLKFKAGTTTADQNAILSSLAGNMLKRLGTNTHMVHVGHGRIALVRGLAKKFPQLVYVEPDYYADPLGDQNSTEDPLTQILEESAAALLRLRSRMIPSRCLGRLRP